MVIEIDKINVLSTVFSRATALFSDSDFIKTFDIMYLLLCIYSINTIQGKTVRFKALKHHINKSDVYLAKRLKEGVSTGHLTVHTSPLDGRARSYKVTEKGVNFLLKCIQT